MGPSFMKVWTRGSFPRSGSRNTWRLIKNFNGAIPLSKTWIFSARSKWSPVAISDHERNLVIPLWSGDKATISGVAAYRLTPPQKSPSAKIQWKSSRLDFLGSRRHLPQWLSSKGPNYQRRVLLISAGAIEGHFEGKPCGKFTKGVLFLHDNAPAHQALATQSQLAYLGSQCFDRPPYSSDLAPSDYHLFPGLKKTIESSPLFVEVITVAATWLDGQLSDSFLMACKS